MSAMGGRDKAGVGADRIVCGQFHSAEDSGGGAAGLCAPSAVRQMPPYTAKVLSDAEIDDIPGRRLLPLQRPSRIFLC